MTLGPMGNCGWWTCLTACWWWVISPSFFCFLFFSSPNGASAPHAKTFVTFFIIGWILLMKISSHCEIARSHANHPWWTVTTCLVIKFLIQSVQRVWSHILIRYFTHHHYIFHFNQTTYVFILNSIYTKNLITFWSDTSQTTTRFLTLIKKVMFFKLKEQKIKR